MPVDPNALATWANAVTVSRILVSPLLFTVIPLDNAGSWLAAWLWFALCVSDVLDGYLLTERFDFRNSTRWHRYTFGSNNNSINTDDYFTNRDDHDRPD